MTKMTFCCISSDICLAINTRDKDTFRTVYKTVTEASPVTEKIAVHFTVIPVNNTPEFFVAFAGSDIAAQTTMHAN